jgi:prepilin-type N-terminal cleavage/methylation domain-containing protein
MLQIKHPPKSQCGFTLVELTTVIILLSIVSISTFTLINTTIKRYFPLHEEGLAFTELSYGSQRVAKVLRGLTDITQADSNGITCYTYFAPQDNYVSLVKYYKSGGSLIVEVTPMTANPPIGTPITASKKTYTVIQKLYSIPNVATFVYVDANNTTMSVPIADLHTIKAIQVNLGIPLDNPSGGGSDTIKLQVSLRNRKTNL